MNFITTHLNYSIFLLRIRTSKADPDPNKIRPDPQHWTQGILQQCR